MRSSPVAVSTSIRSRLSRWWQRHNLNIGILLIYVFFTLLITYPLVFQLSTHLVGDGGDGCEHLWSLWWGKKALLEPGATMNQVTVLYYPWGVYHPFLGVTPLVQVMALPFTLFFNPLVAFNLFFLSTTVLTAYTTYLLCYEITGDRAAAFVGGLIFGFAPTRMAHGLSHLAQVTTQLFPLYAWTVYKFMRKPTWKWGLATGVLLGVSSLVNFVHTAHFVFIFTLYWLVYFLITHRQTLMSFEVLKALAVLFGVGALICLPFFSGLLMDQLSGNLDYDIQQNGTIAFSHNLSGFLLPSPVSPIAKVLGAQDRIQSLIGTGFVESWAYLGILPLFLALWGWWKNKPKARFWLFFAILTIVLSMGPVLKWGNNAVILDVVDGVSVYVPLPYILLRKFPLFGMSRTPGRIAVGTPLALSVLVSLGFVQFKLWLKHYLPRFVIPTLFVTSLVILLEYCVTFPYMTISAEVPEFYKQVKEEEGDFAILDVPLNRAEPRREGFARAMYYQTAHEHPIAGGRIWRLPVSEMNMLVTLDALLVGDDLFISLPYSTEDVRGWLSAMNFRYVVLHKYTTVALWQGKTSPDYVAKMRERFTQMFSSPVYEDEYIVAFRVREDFAMGKTPLPFFSRDWHVVETYESSPPLRWLKQDGQILVYTGKSARYRLEFDAAAFYSARHLEMWVNGERVYETGVYEARHFVTPPFTLNAGANEIVLKSVEPCLLPSDYSQQSADSRCLSISFSQMRWIEVSDEAFGERSVASQFSEYVRLVGYDLDASAAHPDGHVDLTLCWQILEPFPSDDKVLVHLLDAEGNLVAQQDNPPVHGTYPATWLGKGEIVRDEYRVEIPADAVTGPYKLNVGWYDSVTLERLSLQDSGGETALALAEIALPYDGE
ncbi:MAG: hypothetical protein JXA21_21815 [Anaerolineae bacterium]|nr:hypothetical protein [Anaerolineae bacterium]